MASCCDAFSCWGCSCWSPLNGVWLSAGSSMRTSPRQLWGFESIVSWPSLSCAFLKHCRGVHGWIVTHSFSGEAVLDVATGLVSNQWDSAACMPGTLCSQAAAWKCAQWCGWIAMACRLLHHTLPVQYCILGATGLKQEYLNACAMYRHPAHSGLGVMTVTVHCCGQQGCCLVCGSAGPRRV